jgi:transmembrane sensor
LNTITMQKADDALMAIEPQVRAWLIHLRSGRATQEDAQEFKRWCAEDPNRAKAAAMMGSTWNVLGAAAANIADEARANQRRKPQGMRVGRRAFVGFAVAAGASWLALRPPLGLWPALSDFAADYRTGTGEQRRVALSERVSVEMNTQTRLNLLPTVTGTAGPHAIELLMGEAEIIAAAPAAGRDQPIRVIAVVAGKGRLQARVARFDVRRTGEEICVTCVSGSVSFEHPLQRLDLAAGQQVVYDDRRVDSVVPVNPAVVTAWRRGVLEFDGVPLAQVIDEINRYRPGKLILRNAQLGTRRVDAKLSIDRLGGVVQMIQRIYGARVTRLPSGIVLLS